MKKSLILTIALCLCLIGCGNAQQEVVEEPTPTLQPTAEPTPSFNMNEYKKQIVEFKKLVNDDTVVLMVMAEAEEKFLSIKKNISSNKSTTDKDVELAYEYLDKAITNNTHTKESLEADYKKISQMYKDIFLIETDGSKEATQLESDVKILYESYTDFWNIVSTSGHKDIIKIASVPVNDITNAIQDINLFCGE